MEVERNEPTCEISVPVIDIDDADEERVVALIAKASSELGIFQIINHGIPNDVIAKLQSVGRQFFELPQQEKERYSKLPGSQEGYGVALTKEDQGKEAKLGEHRVDHIFHKIWPPSSINYGFWPTDPPSYREANEEYTKYLRVVSDKLLKCLSLGLGLEAKELKEAMGGDNVHYLLKINHYPPCPWADLAIGVPPHTDMSGMTLLVPNDVQGLQLCKDGLKWFDVNHVPNAMIVHIGDQIEIISNGKYKAVFHRSKVNKDRTRLSWPVFVEPPSDLTVGPIPKLVTQENPAKYKTKRYCDYAYCKLKKIPQ